jgi:hypothetical protein
MTTTSVRSTATRPTRRGVAGHSADLVQDLVTAHSYTAQIAGYDGQSLQLGEPEVAAPAPMTKQRRPPRVRPGRWYTTMQAQAYLEMTRGNAWKQIKAFEPCGHALKVGSDWYIEGGALKLLRARVDVEVQIKAMRDGPVYTGQLPPGYEERKPAGRSSGGNRTGQARRVPGAGHDPQDR